MPTPVVAGVDEVVRDEMKTLATWLCLTKQGGGPRFSSTRPNDPDDAAAALERDGKELIQLDEDHARSV
jgi:hypothetical protein